MDSCAGGREEKCKLRRFIDRIGFDSSFIIFDTSDQRTLVKTCIKSIGLDDKMFTDRSVLSEISNAKNEMLEPEQYTVRSNGDFRKEKIALVYEMYQKRLKENNAIDFDDIINYTIKILMETPDILEYYSDKFKYVLVDEYQDTNKAQFTLVTLLASKNGNITVVGDNDQGIYSFRGADISNILNFERDFPGTKIIKLEQNYRCTGNILKAANAVIKNNEVTYKKELWTENEVGKLPTVYSANNEYDEGTYIAQQIEHLRREEYYKYSDFAILYRMNTQSRAIEELLRRESIPYKIIGGLKFYERKEIKDMVAYLRVIQNPQDDISLKRIINVPRRGIGLRTIEKIEDRASLKEESLYSVLIDIDGNSDISRKAKASINGFVDIMSTFRSLKQIYPASKMIEKVMDITGYLDELEKDKSEESQDRIENLKEFISVAMEFESKNEDTSLEAFLTNVALTSEPNEEEEHADRVSLMTIHSAKGLEFPVVFLTGMEEKLFPIARAIASMQDTQIEEERRLCYVGITRAKEELFMTMTGKRTLYGRTNHSVASRFIEELPDDCVERLNKVQKEISYSKASYNMLDKYT